MKVLASLVIMALGFSSLATALPAAFGSTSLKAKARLPPPNQWQIYSLREQPFDDALLRFSLLDPSTGHETDCETNLPMSGYVACSDGLTAFVYGGVSYQYGETWLALGKEMDACPDKDSKQGCTVRSATATISLPDGFWQQPGWNSWVHPEALDVVWAWQ